MVYLIGMDEGIATRGALALEGYGASLSLEGKGGVLLLVAAPGTSEGAVAELRVRYGAGASPSRRSRATRQVDSTSSRSMSVV